MILPGDTLPSPQALEAVCGLAGPAALIQSISRLDGGQHSKTWRVDTQDPASSVIVRQFPAGDRAANSERRVLDALDGLAGLAPLWLGGDLEGVWSEGQTSLLSRLPGRADITPHDPRAWAAELGRALAVVHSVPVGRLAQLPHVFQGKGSPQLLEGPLASAVAARWAEVTGSPESLVHGDYWSGNVVAQDGKATGVVDWSGAARGPRGYDVAWCRLDLVLLFDATTADAFLSEYELASAAPVGDTALWDSWAAARSHTNVETWGPNYGPLERADLDARELRRRHAQWSAHLVALSDQLN